MKHFSTLLLALAVLATPAVADGQSLSRNKAHTPQAHVLRTAPGGTASLAAADDQTYRVTPLLTEDFSLWTAGSPDTPDATDLANATTGAIADSYMHTSGWVGSLVYQAGGTCCVGYDEDSYMSGLLSSPDIDFKGRTGKFVVTLRARNVKPYGTSKYDNNYVCVDVIDADADRTFTNDYSTLTTEWQDYRFEFTKERDASHHYYIQFYGYYASIDIDDIVVSYQDEYVKTPETSAFTDFRADGFTANWQPAEGATSYLVYLYTLDGKTPSYIGQPVTTTQTSYTFTGLNTTDNIYYYAVSATDGTHTSPKSKGVKVESLLVPQNVAIADKGNGSFTMSWEVVPNAQYYELVGNATHKAAADETVTLLEENFDGITDYDDYTPEAPYGDLPKQEELDSLTTQPGWIATYPVRVNGAYGIDGYGYYSYGVSVYVETPILDLTANGGTVEVKADLMGIDNTTAVVRMGHVEGNKWVVDDKADVTDLTASWKPYTFTLHGGTAASSVEFCCKGPSYMYIDNVKVSQTLHAGESATIPVYAEKVTEGTDTTLTVPAFVGSDEVECRVRAIKEVWDEYHFSCDYVVYSPYSAAVAYTPAAAISTATAQASASARIEDGTLYVSNPSKAAVSVFTADGKAVYTERAGRSALSTTLPSDGLYIIKVGDTTLKIAK